MPEGATEEVVTEEEVVAAEEVTEVSAAKATSSVI